MKDQAKELVEKFKKVFQGNYLKTDKQIKQCALICVDFMMNELDTYDMTQIQYDKRYRKYQQLKQEIEKS